MPIIYQKTTRRDFLRILGNGAGAVAAMTLFPSFAVAGKKDARLALFSDIHIPEDKTENYRGFYPYENLKKVVATVRESDVQGAVISGDLARLEGKKGDYMNLKQLLDPLAGKVPVAMAMGNHDRRDHFLEVFPEASGDKQQVKNRYVLVLDYPSVRVILLDSLIYTNLSPALGLLGKSQRTWLSNYLNKHRDKPVILVEHHTLGDNDGDLQDVEKLFDIIRSHEHVKAIIFGHSHVYRYDVRDDIHLINLPAVGYNFRDADPLGWVEATLTPKKGIFKLHAMMGNTAEDGKVTELKWR